MEKDCRANNADISAKVDNRSQLVLNNINNVNEDKKNMLYFISDIF